MPITKSKENKTREHYIMGMAASQARLLSITARLTDNENSGQRLSSTKISLANRTEQLNADYNAALDQTKLTILTGFNGSEEVYTDLNFKTLTGYNTIAGGKQYCITDTSGRILVDQKIADAFEKGNGDYNVFLAELGYTQADIIANVTDTDDEEGQAKSLKMIHEAWDKYLNSVGKSIGDILPLHPDGEITEATFGFHFNDGDSSILNGYPTVAMTEVTTTTTENDYSKPIAWEKKKVDLGTGATVLGTPNTADDGNVNPLGSTAGAQNVVTDAINNNGATTDDLEVTSWQDKVTGKTINGVQIKTLRGLEIVMQQFATNPAALQQNYILANDAGESLDLDLSTSALGRNWGGISSFQGLFDGNGSTLRNISGSQGIFSDLYGTVQNLNVDNITISAESDCLGGMAGYLADGASITNCNITNLTLNCNLRDQEYAAGYSVQHAAIGGLVGRNDGDVTNTLVEGTINVPNATDSFSGIGGFIGLNANKDHQNATVSNSYADVDIVLGTSSGADSFSGAINNFIGNDINEMLITNCAAMGDIRGNGSIQLVDLAGYGMALESDTKNSVAYNPRTGEYVYWTDSADAAYPSAKTTDNIKDDLADFTNEQEDGEPIWVTPDDGDDYNNTGNQGDLQTNGGLALNLNALQGATGEIWVDDLTKPTAWEQITKTDTIPAETKPIPYEGWTAEQKELYDYAVAITSQYFSEKQSYDNKKLQTAADKENVPYITYLKNIFDKMSVSGYFTYTSDPDKISPANPYFKNYIYKPAVVNDTGTRVDETPIKDSQVLEDMLRSGELLLETYSAKAGGFVSTTLSDDECIQEVEDERAIALAEAKYTTDMLMLENQDVKIDLQLKKLDAEHTALQTEYDSLKTVIDKNIEKSFNMFS